MEVSEYPANDNLMCFEGGKINTGGDLGSQITPKKTKEKKKGRKRKRKKWEHETHGIYVDTPARGAVCSDDLHD